MMISVAAFQAPLGGGLTLEDKLHLIRQRPDVVCLPEYFFVRPTDQSYDDSVPLLESRLAELKHLSKDLGCTVIGGTMPHPVNGGYGNIATVFNRGTVVGSYQKVNPYGREEQRGIVPGSEYRVFEVDGFRLGILICADVLNSESFSALARLNADVIFVPTVSPRRPSDTIFEKDHRDISIFVAGAQRACAYVVKTCGIGSLFGGDLQGRSGIFAPWGILRRVPPDCEEKKLILNAVLDIDEIREFKRMMAPDELQSADIASQS
ncbi:MAG: carbon-nitrogen hydrolase family protein [Candidatus Zixiibacteriota bacterium]